MHIGKKIQTVRHSKFWTQEYLAERAEISERTVSRLENCRKISKFSLQKILEALNTSLEELDAMTEESDKQKKQYTTPTDVNISYRINDGRELMQLIPDTHMYGYDYHDCITKEQVELAQNVLISIGDAIDIWGMLELAQRFTLENLLNELIRDLEKVDLWLFGNRKIDEKNCATTIIEIYSKNNPLIMKYDMK